MAAVSAPFTSRSLTPPTSSHGAQGAWGYSVPLDNQIPLETTVDQPNHEIPAARQPLTGHTNTSLTGKRSRNELSQIRPPSRSNILQSPAFYTAGRKENPMIEPGREVRYSPEFQESGSPIDIGPGAINNRDYKDDEDPEYSRWIHKDKLERMEHEEMERLGIKIPAPRVASMANGRSKSRDRLHAGAQGQPKKQKTEPTHREGEDVEGRRLDSRMPEERDINDAPREYAAKPTSRIPIPTKSPLPIQMDFIERDNRIIKGPVSEEPMSYSKPRGRSGSVKALDESMLPSPNMSSPTIPTPRSTSAQAATTDVSPTTKTGARKSSAPAGRTTAGQQRPKTRSGSNATRLGKDGAGSASKRPEGDPPWLATMYKPDPRLPPDQQLLPTHAKRMQQEQWEKDGKFGTTYDTSFRPLNDDSFGEPPSPPTEFVEVKDDTNDKIKDDKPEDQPGWPLACPQTPGPRANSPKITSLKSPTFSTGPKSPTSPTSRPGTAGGGYSTMPKITSPVRQQSSPLPTSPSATQLTMPPIRIPEEQVEEEKGKGKKKEAGCACCIVM